MRYFILLSLLITNFIFSTEDTRLLSIEKREDAWHIFLSNDLEFLWSPSEDENRMLNHWQPGNEISISPNFLDNGLTLRNYESLINYFPQVYLTPESADNLPTIVKVKGESDYMFLTLSDGSAWHRKYLDESIKYWKKGDPVLVDGTCLINYRISLSDDEDDRYNSYIYFTEL